MKYCLNTSVQERASTSEHCYQSFKAHNEFKHLTAFSVYNVFHALCPKQTLQSHASLSDSVSLAWVSVTGLHCHSVTPPGGERCCCQEPGFAVVMTGPRQQSVCVLLHSFRILLPFTVSLSPSPSPSPSPSSAVFPFLVNLLCVYIHTAKVELKWNKY